MREYWTANADRVTDGNWRILGEDEWGELVVPRSPERWQGRFNPWNPMHWRFWLRSRLTNRLAFVEQGPS